MGAFLFTSAAILTENHKKVKSISELEKAIDTLRSLNYNSRSQPLCEGQFEG